MIIFFVLLCAPTSFLVYGKYKLRGDNRMAADFPAKIDKNLADNFEKWFSDRIGFREQMIWLAYQARAISRFYTNDRAETGRRGWMYMAPGFGRGPLEYIKDAPLSEDELKDISARLAAWDNLAKKKGARFYFLIAPDKPSVYPEYMVLENAPKRARAMSLVNHLRANTNIRAVYPADELAAAKSDNLLYYRCDSHWAPSGAQIAARALMTRIRRDDKSFNLEKYEATKIERAKKTDLADMLRRKCRRDKIRFYSNERKYKCDSFGGGYWNKGFDDCEGRAANAARALFVGDSMVSAIKEYLKDHFQNLRLTHRNAASEKNLDAKADIIILEVVEREIADGVPNAPGGGE